MGWGIFRAERRSVEPDDDFHPAIESIEKFAPKRFLEEREMYYYNYGQIPKYRKPLLSLLIQLSEKTGIDENEELSVQTLFRKLKDFYDINDKISLKEVNSCFRYFWETPNKVLSALSKTELTSSFS